MGTKERKHSKSEDEALFRRQFADAQPIKARQRHQPETGKPAKARFRQSDEQAVLREAMSDESLEREPDFTDELSFQRSSVNRKLMRELRRGKLAMQAELDLHGYARAAARAELQDFIYECTDRGLRCVRIVHGKGLGSGPDGPVLKVAVNRWLRRWDDVLAFCPARNQHGGTGALYVLLRSR